jgi:hypothetical protein
MEPAQIIAMVLGSTVLGGVITKSMDWIRDARAGHLQARRAEVDRAKSAEAVALEKRDAAIDAEEEQARKTRIAEESLAIHRRVIIDAPCLGPEALPPYYPSRKD